MGIKILDNLRPPRVDLEWKVIYKDGSVLKQNYRKKNEHHFGHIKINEVKEFWLGNKYMVDLERQSFKIEGKEFFVKFPKNTKGKLVYFRRIRNDFSPNGQVASISYCLGLQANIDGRNYQQYLFINPDGSFTLSQEK